MRHISIGRSSGWLLLCGLLLLWGCAGGSSSQKDTAGGNDAQTTSDTNVPPKDTSAPADTSSQPDASSDVSKADIGDPPANCGNGTLDPGEKCDIGIAAGQDGACPTSCKATEPCTTKSLTGVHCQVECVVSVITEIGLADGCCPSGANSDTDKDCSETCGNGQVDEGETCDIRITTGEGKCPVTCEDNNPCTTDIPIGSLCQTKCLNVEITDFINGDGCCPKNGTPETDSDCKPTVTCGNGTKDPGELCDTAILPGNKDACPKLGDCTTSDVCKKPKLIGSGCTTSCGEEEITELKDGDGCCPKDATFADDKDCPQQLICGNGTLESNESCDTLVADGQFGSCQKRCEDYSPCTADTRVGTSCDRHCANTAVLYSPQTLDSDFDGCCLPAGDATAWDEDFDCYFVASFRGLATNATLGDEIPTGQTTQKTITISEAFTIKKVARVFVDLQHPRTADLTLTLKVDGGAEVVLKAAGGSGPFLPTLFTVDAVNIANGVRVTGLSQFAGGASNKAWTLTITDSGGGVGGRFNGWRLDFVQDTQTELGTAFYATDLPATVGTGSYPGATTIESSIEVTGVESTKNIEVYTDITHPWQADLKLTLLLPSGTPVVLKTGNPNGNLDPPFIPAGHEHIFTSSSDDMRALVYRHDDPACTANPACDADQICFGDSCLTRGVHSVKSSDLESLFGQELFKTGTYTLRVENLTSLQSGTLVNWWIRFF